jgi:hypothetical protein
MTASLCYLDKSKDQNYSLVRLGMVQMNGRGLALACASVILVSACNAIDLPEYDISRFCKFMAISPNALDCINDEKRARNEVANIWSSFPDSKKKACMGAVEAMRFPPAYISLMTCLKDKDIQ